MKHIRSYFLLALLVGIAVPAASCTIRGGAAFRSSPSYDHQLVEVSPGIWVVEDYDQSVFYSDGYYWRYGGGVWYRSHSYNNGWVHVSHNYVPHAVVRIDSPNRYVHYRARGNARVRAQPVHRANHRVNARPGTRDHRRPAPAVRDHRRAAPAPRVRDHRQPKKSKSRDHRRP